MTELKDVLVYTNPLIWPVGVGILMAAILAAVFGGVAKNVKTISKNIGDDW